MVRNAKLQLCALLAGNNMSFSEFAETVEHVRQSTVVRDCPVFRSVVTLMKPVQVGGRQVMLRAQWSLFGRDSTVQFDDKELSQLPQHARSVVDRYVAGSKYRRWVQTYDIIIVRHAQHSVASITRVTRSVDFGEVITKVEVTPAIGPFGDEHPGAIVAIGEIVDSVFQATHQE